MRQSSRPTRSAAPTLSANWRLNCYAGRARVSVLLAAEKHLRQYEVLPGYSLVVLKVVELPGTPPELRLAASVLFKNFVKVRVLRERSACSRQLTRDCDGCRCVAEVVGGGGGRDLRDL